ncbi:membrane protein insertase YidC [Synechococcus elongatus]|uniref:membrane protein insertase YidC n=1 Tax=Synechococcus elongatus TaxID=32046 RepID=UPI000F7D7563|nr:membrane protein insertase YidC [Synechococcus elongatus]
MDFGIGFLSSNVMLPILDFFYGLVPSYGLAIIALTLVIRIALYPLSAGAIRNARRMRIANPVMQKRQQEIRERYANDPSKLQEETAKLFKEFGNPLAGCFPLLLQMPLLFALFATLRGSPFADINYTVNLQVLPSEQIAQVQPRAFSTKPQNVFVADGVHYRVAAVLPAGTQLGVGDRSAVTFQGTKGESFESLVGDRAADLKPTWSVTKGSEHIRVGEDGVVEAVSPGDATLQVTIPGIAANNGFLFIKALGEVGIQSEDGINWDVLGLVLAFGVSLYVSQQLSSQGAAPNPQQDQVNKITPVLFSGMFLFFPLPAGVLMYMVIANIFQTLQTFILMREPLPENLQKLVTEGAGPAGGSGLSTATAKNQTIDTTAERLPFEPGGNRKKKNG